MKIREMTMRTGQLNAAASQNFVDNHKNDWLQSPIIGQIESYDLRMYDSIYSLWNKTDYVASARLSSPDANGISETGLFHVAEKYRGQKILPKLLWNFKTRQNRTLLKIDSYHSDELYEILRDGGLSRFTKYWMNSSGEIAEYDPTTIDRYYSYSGKTGWQLILENSNDFSDMPHYTNGKDWIKEDYSWQIE